MFYTLILCIVIDFALAENESILIAMLIFYLQFDKFLGASAVLVLQDFAPLTEAG